MPLKCQEIYNVRIWKAKDILTSNRHVSMKPKSIHHVKDFLKSVQKNSIQQNSHFEENTILSHINFLLVFIPHLLACWLDSIW